MNEPSTKSTLFSGPENDTMYRLLLDYCLRIMGRKAYSVRELRNKMKLKIKRLEKYSESGYLKKIFPKKHVVDEHPIDDLVSSSNVRAQFKGDDQSNCGIMLAEPIAQEPSVAIDAVIAKLTEWGYLSDKKIIDSAIEAATSHAPKGPNAFIASMLKKGIDKDDARTAWSNKGVDERALAIEVVKKYSPKYRKLDTQAKKRRLAGVLARKGFLGETIWSVLGEVV